VQLRGQRISSSQIRRLLTEGKVNLARRMLGRPYGVEGRVVHGQQRGRTIGFPTANLMTNNRVIPRAGVYVTAILIEGAWRRSITNIGVRPTFEQEAQPTIETFVLDWNGDLYGDVIRVRFLHRVRDERKFGGIEELKTQIGRDLRRAERYFELKGVRQNLNIV
jgi:riboflavin kinase/FMN adenylyltransferase